VYHANTIFSTPNKPVAPQPSPTQSISHSNTHSVSAPSEGHLEGNVDTYGTSTPGSTQNSPGWKAWREKRRQERRVIREGSTAWASVRRSSSITGLNSNTANNYFGISSPDSFGRNRKMSVDSYPSLPRKMSVDSYGLAHSPSTTPGTTPGIGSIGSINGMIEQQPRNRSATTMSGAQASGVAATFHNGI
jgi:hypothetical protein